MSQMTMMRMMDQHHEDGDDDVFELMSPVMNPLLVVTADRPPSLSHFPVSPSTPI